MNGAVLISTRQREVWLYENKRLLDRLAKMLITADVRLKLECANEVCPDPRITLAQDDTHPAGRVLRCGCKDRHVEPAGIRRH